MKKKDCTQCGEQKKFSEFYRSRNAYQSQCKECHKANVRLRYRATIEKQRLYDKKRQQDPKRRAAKIRFMQSYRKRHPAEYKARMAVHNALRDGRLFRSGCELCGAKAQAHHDDYSKPLKVRWLCFKHHREHHGQKVA